MSERKKASSCNFRSAWNRTQHIWTWTMGTFAHNETWDHRQQEKKRRKRNTLCEVFLGFLYRWAIKENHQIVHAVLFTFSNEYWIPTLFHLTLHIFPSLFLFFFFCCLVYSSNPFRFCFTCGIAFLNIKITTSTAHRVLNALCVHRSNPANKII